MTSGVGDVPAEPAPPPDAPAEAPGKPNPWQRIVGVFMSPVETLRDIARRPDWAVPLLVFLVVAVASAAIMSTRLDMAGTVREQMERRHAPQEQIDKAVPMAVAISKVAMYASPVLNVLFLLLLAAVLMTGMRMFGGEGEFRQAFSATIYGWMPMVLYSVLVAIVALTRTSITGDEVQTLLRSNLAFLTTQADHPMLYSLLTSLDVFKIWTAVLLTIGFSELSRLSRAAAGAIVAFLWGLVILVAVGFAALQGVGGA